MPHQPGHLPTPFGNHPQQFVDAAQFLTSGNTGADLNNTLATFLGASFQADSLANQNTSRRNEFLMGQFQDFLGRGSTLGEDQLNSLRARGIDEANNAAVDDFSFLRSQLGSAGITGGGLAAGLGAQVSLRRMGQITGRDRDLRIAKMQQDALDARANMDASFSIGNFLGEEPSMIGIDALAQGVGLQFGRHQLEVGAKAARDAASNDLTGSLIGLGGSLIGGALGIG